MYSGAGTVSGQLSNQIWIWLQLGQKKTFCTDEFGQEVFYHPELMYASPAEAHA